MVLTRSRHRYHRVLTQIAIYNLAMTYALTRNIPAAGGDDIISQPSGRYVMSVTASTTPTPPPFPSAKQGMTSIRADPLANWPLRLLPQQPVAVRAGEMRPDPRVSCEAALTELACQTWSSGYMKSFFLMIQQILFSVQVLTFKITGKLCIFGKM